jgi:hypothetical protein
MQNTPNIPTRLEPEGHFRWLHDRRSLRCARSPESIVDRSPQDWSPEAVVSMSRDELDALVPVNTWIIGTFGNTQLLDDYWSRLTPQQRGQAIAGVSEWKDRRSWLESHLGDCRFDAVSATQAACNTLLDSSDTLLEEVVSRCDDLEGHITRFTMSRTRSDKSFDGIVSKLATRAIDLMLEAALLVQNTEAVRFLLRRGADPNIPLWHLDRSFNERHCALSHAIESRADEIASALLESGAQPQGIDFCTPNLPLFAAVATNNHALALRLLREGASFADSEKRNQRQTAIANARKKKLISPANDYFFGHFKDDLAWARDKIGSLVSFVSVGEKPCFYRGSGQGGYWRTFVDAAGSDVAVIQSYEAFGLDTRLTAEEFLSVVQSNAYDKLVYLLRNETEAVKGRVMFRVRRWQPDFGAEGPLALRPQEDGTSEALDFYPGSQEPLILPDGSELFVDLDAIAAPDHPHGPCLKGHFWHLSEKPTLRRRGSRTILKNLHPRWEMAEKPGNNHQLKHLLPVVRRFEGRFIHLGCTMGQLGFQTEDEKLAGLIHRWDESPGFRRIADEAKRRIAAQDQSNLRPPAPVLTRDELDGYPKEFWPFLVRLPSGLIGMDESAVGAATFRNYRTWERENKREDTFVPDPRIVDHDVWNEVPPEMKPYLVWDNLFNRPGFTYSADTEYDRAMVRKATRWWNNFVMGRLQAIIPPLLEVIDEKGKEG